MTKEDKTEKMEKVLTQLNKTTDQELSKLASAMGVPKDQAVQMALRQLAGDKKEDQPSKVDKYTQLLDKMKETDMGGGNSGKSSNAPSMQDLIMYKMFGGVDKEEDNKKSDDFDLNKIMAFQAIKQMFQPNPMEMMMYKQMMGDEDKEGKSGEKEDFTRQMFQQQQQQQQNLMNAMFGKERQESQQKISEMERQNTEQQYQAKLDFAENVLPRLMQLENKLSQMEQGGRKGLVEEMQEYTAFQNAMKEFAREHGFVEGGKEGKIDWQGIAQQILGLGKEAVNKMPNNPPPQPKQMNPLPTQKKTIPQPSTTQKTDTSKTETPKKQQPEPHVEPLTATKSSKSKTKSK